MDISRPNLMTVKQLAERYQAWTPASIRSLILNAEDRLNSKGEKVAGNGLGAAIIRVGRRVLIDEQKFLEWVYAQARNHKRPKPVERVSIGQRGTA